MLTYFRDHASGPTGVWAYLWAHFYLSVLPVVIGLVIALPLGWLAARYKFAYPALISIAGLIYTIPSLVLFVAMPGILHTQILSVVNIIVALAAYAVALLVRVVADGLKSVPAETKQAATAMGYKAVGRFFAVELPLAVPVIAAGVRVATVSNVSLVAVATLVGTAQLGTLIDTGFHAGNDPYSPIGLAIVLCLLLALALDFLIQLISRLLTPWRKAVPNP
ncbi:osmoprotectant transport system permease protein [Nakamurella panacisegetis]|uniref:Osmoprotectant transport system permease protein n=1 Tax=Nakamurella panacisegetis TaxID=1090615 RepID=A0A1H0NVQ3_9ACTN|nr:ABC transporter permease subunit [Nakamurella panacisegetis]SDO96842.1 osmoprotectant transport system permease protein [Nakamurella panacisegetis]